MRLYLDCFAIIFKAQNMYLMSLMYYATGPSIKPRVI